MTQGPGKAAPHVTDPGPGAPAAQMPVLAASGAAGSGLPGPGLSGPAASGPAASAPPASGAAAAGSADPRAAYWRGVRSGLPFVIVMIPFALLFGVIGTEAGLNIAEVMGFSVFVIAGASQIAALQLMADNAPTLVVLATALAVNMRMAMYSAALAPHFGAAPLRLRAVIAYMVVDQSFAVSMAEFDRRPHMARSEKIGYFFGTLTPVLPAWYGGSLAGALAGASIPPAFALDFAVPITFVAITAPMLRTLAHLAAAFVSVAGALLLAFLPYNIGLLVAAVLAMMAGAQVEVRMTRRRAPRILPGVQP